MVRVKGTKISSKVRFVRERYGPEMLDEVLRRLPAEDRTALHGMVDVGWYPQEIYDRVIGAIVQVAAGGDPAVLDAIGRHTAEVQAGGAYKGLYQTRDPVTVLRRMVPMHRQLNDPAEMEMVISGPQWVSLVVRQPRSSPTLCRIARSFYLRTVELCGAAGASVSEPSCSGRGDASCRFEIRWEGLAS